ncbi:MAG: hypothetical protein RIS84_897 [Pseudomonadota bacterium]|jgi:hypothetical protein
MNWLHTGQQKIQSTLEEQLPKIQQLFTEKVSAVVLAKIQDDESMKWAAQKIYEVLPLPVRLVVKETAFIEFCLTHRDKLLPAPIAPLPQLTPEEITASFKQGVEHYNQQSFTQAIDYFTQAAEQGYAAAQNNLGMMYAQGLGIEKNLELAEQWLQKAAVQGHLKAQKSLEILKKNIQVSE